MSDDRAPEPILCLGEAIVDLVCERTLDSPTDADAFVPHFGGALANVAVAAARAGGEVAIAGGVGDDEWGSWLRSRLDAEGVGLRWFAAVEGLHTPIAFVTFDRDLEPRFTVYGDGISAALRSFAASLDEGLGAAGALAFGSNTLVGEPERELTWRARRLALERGVPVLFDPNIRPNRWRDLERAVRLSREAVEGALLVHANLEEARQIGGRPGADPVEAAEGLCALGVRVAAVTAGADGAVVRGEASAEVMPAPAVDVVSPLGSGDAFFGTLAAAMRRSGWAPEGAAGALGQAVEAGSRACGSWGALE